MGSSCESKFKKEQYWPSLDLGGSDTVSKAWYLRSRIAMTMESLTQNLPAHNNKDLMVINRCNDKGIWKNEVWTLKDFAPLKLMFAPHSSQLKDTHLMVNGHAIVSVPKHGKGAHPDNKTLALDGRGRSKLAAKGSIDDEDHEGSLYWIIGRTSKPKEVNLQSEQVSCDINIAMTLPSEKKALTKTWASADMPAIQILVNKKAIAKHTMLLAFQNAKEE